MPFKKRITKVQNSQLQYNKSKRYIDLIFNTVTHIYYPCKTIAIERTDIYYLCKTIAIERTDQIIILRLNASRISN